MYEKILFIYQKIYQKNNCIDFVAKQKQITYDKLSKFNSSRIVSPSRYNQTFYTTRASACRQISYVFFMRQSSATAKAFVAWDVSYFLNLVLQLITRAVCRFLKTQGA